MLNDPLAAQMGLLVMRSEDMYDSLPLPQRGKLDPPLSVETAAAYELKGYISGRDCLLGIDPLTGKRQMLLGTRVFYGFVACSKANPHQYVVPIRGTGNLVEWALDGEFITVPHPRSGGRVEQGFYSIYDTMQFHAYSNGAISGTSTRAAEGIAALIPDGKVTVLGHSLGSALATYLALDLADVQAMDTRVTTCMFASPRPGDTPFVDYFDKKVATYTLYNYARDAVTMVPLLFGYSSLPRATKIAPADAQADISYDPLLPLEIHNLACQHHVVCYAAMLDFHAADWAKLPAIDQACAACIVGPKAA